MIVLDLPAPLSVNRTRRIDWAAKPRIRAWVRRADALVMSQGRLPKRISGQFEAKLIYPEHGAIDLDNGPKGILDYARRLELIADDSPKYMRRVTLEFGEVPEGCRLILQEWPA
jgi:hypothetical protein